jgi:hypothetical protein
VLEQHEHREAMNVQAVIPSSQIDGQPRYMLSNMEANGQTGVKTSAMDPRLPLE